jgi:TP901 family phage tail tape measure protein
MALGASFPVSFILRAVDQTARGVRGADTRIGKLGKSSTKAGRMMTLGLTAPIIGAGVAIFRTAANFEKGMNRVTALSSTSAESVEALERDMLGLEGTARKLGQTTTFTATQVTDAMGFYAQAGYDAQQITAATLPTLNLAAAAQIELGESADITAGILAGYSWEASKAGKVSDILTNAFTKAKTDLPALGEAMQDIGPIASGMGIGLAESVAAVQALSEKSIPGAEAGTKLRNMILAIQKPTPTAVRALNALKIEARELVDEFGNVKGFTAIVEALTKAGAQPKHLSSIFNKRDIAAVMALMAPGADGTPGFERLRKFEAGLLDVGVASKIAKIQMRGAAGATARFEAAIEGLAISIGQSGFLEWASDSIDAVTGWTKSMSDTDPVMLNLGKNLLVFVAIAGPVVWAAGVMTTAITAIGTAASAAIALVAGIGIMGKEIYDAASFAKKVIPGASEQSWPDFLWSAHKANMQALPWNQPYAHIKDKTKRPGYVAPDRRFEDGLLSIEKQKVWTQAWKESRGVLEHGNRPTVVKFENTPPGVTIDVPSGTSGIDIGYSLPDF